MSRLSALRSRFKKRRLAVSGAASSTIWVRQCFQEEGRIRYPSARRSFCRKKRRKRKKILPTPLYRPRPEWRRFHSLLQHQPPENQGGGYPDQLLQQLRHRRQTGVLTGKIPGGPCRYAGLQKESSRPSALSAGCRAGCFNIFKTEPFTAQIKRCKDSKRKQQSKKTAGD